MLSRTVFETTHPAILGETYCAALCAWDTAVVKRVLARPVLHPVAVDECALHYLSFGSLYTLAIAEVDDGAIHGQCFAPPVSPWTWRGFLRAPVFCKPIYFRGHALGRLCWVLLALLGSWGFVVVSDVGCASA